jgi:hypothetical protein
MSLRRNSVVQREAKPLQTGAIQTKEDLQTGVIQSEAKI